jgi:hypothetical protein
MLDRMDFHDKLGQREAAGVDEADRTSSPLGGCARHMFSGWSVATEAVFNCRITGESISLVCGSIVSVADAILDTLQDRRSKQDMTKEVVLRHDRQSCRE